MQLFIYIYSSLSDNALTLSFAGQMTIHTFLAEQYYLIVHRSIMKIREKASTTKCFHGTLHCLGLKATLVFTVVV